MTWREKEFDQGCIGMVADLDDDLRDLRVQNILVPEDEAAVKIREKAKPLQRCLSKDEYSLE